MLLLTHLHFKLLISPITFFSNAKHYSISPRRLHNESFPWRRFKLLIKAFRVFSIKNGKNTETDGATKKNKTWADIRYMLWPNTLEFHLGYAIQSTAWRHVQRWFGLPIVKKSKLSTLNTSVFYNACYIRSDITRWCHKHHVLVKLVCLKFALDFV